MLLVLASNFFVLGFNQIDVSHVLCLNFPTMETKFGSVFSRILAQIMFVTCYTWIFRTRETKICMDSDPTCVAHVLSEYFHKKGPNWNTTMLQLNANAITGPPPSLGCLNRPLPIPLLTRQSNGM